MRRERMNVGSATISVAHGVVAAAAVGPILAACDAIRWRAAILCILPAPTTAQWMDRIPDAPRTTSNAIDLAAPAPRNSAGRVDLSGIWQTDPKYNTNLAADLGPDDVPMLPAARQLYQERQRISA